MKRFWNKVDIRKEDECWEWQGAIRNGYGAIKIDGSVKSAHRVCATLFNKEIEDKVVCHHCDNPSCVNPKHLFIGTQSDNMKDAVEKGRRYQPSREECAKGDQSYNRNLEEEKAKQIKREIKKRKYYGALKDIAKKYGVKHQTVKDISRGKSYSNISV